MFVKTLIIIDIIWERSLHSNIIFVFIIYDGKLYILFRAALSPNTDVQSGPPLEGRPSSNLVQRNIHIDYPPCL